LITHLPVLLVFGLSLLNDHILLVKRDFSYFITDFLLHKHASNHFDIKTQLG